MGTSKESGNLKRERDTVGDNDKDLKKPRRSTRIPKQLSQLPTPITNQESSSGDSHRDGTVTPPEGRPSQIQHHHRQGSAQLDSPPVDTQPFSQLTHPSNTLSDQVKDEDEEGVWGYLVPLDNKFGDTLVLRRRAACPAPSPKADFGRASRQRAHGASESCEQFVREEEAYEEAKKNHQGFPAGGFLIGRHRECDRVLNLPTISNRHCLIFNETKDGDAVAILQDLSSNGTFVNEVIVGRNKHRELQDGDEITILDQTRFIFRYPKNRDGNAFRRQYRVLDQLGRGHFATVYLCVEKATGYRYAVKKFERRPGEHNVDNLKQEIAVLMSVSHPNMLCLKDSFEEEDGVYLVLELAPEGELFNWIVMKQKLSEEESRKVFIQLFQGVKYLHDRGIVHRDIKPENILLVDKDLTVKLADFGLAKIIGEASFTTTLCGTPSYVAPEILENSKHRRYTRAVDIWSLGVVLYICLCGFPPFSDELNTKDNPYSLAQQIRSARFDYPSPYWDSVGDPALDLIDKMLTVDPEQRATVEECLEHPWITQKPIDPAASMDSTDGLPGALQKLDFSKRKAARERTLLSSLNSVTVSKAVDDGALKIWEKNPTDGAKAAVGESKVATTTSPNKEDRPDKHRAPEEFMGMGGQGDMRLFDTDPSSRYAVNQDEAAVTKGAP